jgi:hypothetical protein
MTAGPGQREEAVWQGEEGVWLGLRCQMGL